jgi:hypothetical protein
MACDVTKGKVALACKNSVSGIKAIYIANYDDYGFVTESTESGHTLNDLGTLAEVFKYELKNAGNTFQQDINSNRDNGTTFFNQVLNFILTKIGKEMEFQIKMLAWGRPQIFVELNSGQIFLMGKNHGCEIAGNSAVGGTMDSLNGYTLTATAMEPDPIFYLADAEVTALKALVSVDNITE